jgi:hypothetical protein
MNIDNIDINSFINKYIDFVDEISNKHRYESNIKHLLYLIVPAFVIKYDIKNEKHILKCFNEIPIVISGNEDKTVTAAFNRRVLKDGDGYKTIKVIILNEYKTANLTNLLDSIIHEYNHAVNSINNEVTWDDKVIRVRTGLSHIFYDKNSLNYLSKSNEVALEEILNTMQTEEIINIINSFNNKPIDNYEFSSMLYSLKNEIGKESFKSEAYYYDSLLTSELVKNKTFTPTICNLRLNGMIEDIPYLFDNVLGINGEYDRLNSLLTSIHKKEIEYGKRTMFRNLLLNDIKKDSLKVINLIREYDNKCIYKHTN